MEIFLPVSVEEAVHRLESGKAKVLAGGTDLILALQKQEVHADYLVDLDRIAELRKIAISDSSVIVGSMVTFSALAGNPILKDKVPALWDMARSMGACQIQNRATIGGNICNAAPAADSAPVLMALAADCIVMGPEGERVIPMEGFLAGKGKTVLRSCELLTGFAFGLPGPGEGCGFAKLGKRNALAISTISCAVRIKAEGRRIIAADVFTGSLGPTASREKNTEAFLKGKDIGMLDTEQAAVLLSEEVEHRLGSRASIVYKRVAVKGVFKEAFRKAVEDVLKESMPDLGEGSGSK